MNWDGFRSEYIATGTSIIQESQEEEAVLGQTAKCHREDGLIVDIQTRIH